MLELWLQHNFADMLLGYGKSILWLRTRQPPPHTSGLSHSRKYHDFWGLWAQEYKCLRAHGPTTIRLITCLYLQM